MKRINVVFSVVYLIVLVATVVTLDIAFFQHHTELRLFANIGTVAVFLIGYLLLSRFVFNKKG